MPSCRNLNYVTRGKRCEFKRLVSFKTFLRIKATLAILILPTCNYFTFLSQEQRVFVATTHLCYLRVQIYKSIYEFWLLNSCASLQAQLTVFVVAPAVNLILILRLSDADSKIVTTTNL